MGAREIDEPITNADFAIFNRLRRDSPEPITEQKYDRKKKRDELLEKLKEKRQRKSFLIQNLKAMEREEAQVRKGHPYLPK